MSTEFLQQYTSKLLPLLSKLETLQGNATRDIVADILKRQFPGIEDAHNLEAKRTLFFAVLGGATSIFSAAPLPARFESFKKVCEVAGRFLPQVGEILNKFSAGGMITQQAELRLSQEHFLLRETELKTKLGEMRGQFENSISKLQDLESRSYDHR